MIILLPLLTVDLQQKLESLVEVGDLLSLQRFILRATTVPTATRLSRLAL